MFNSTRRIHFVGIGGIGMSGIAEVLANLGYEVSGSDIKDSPAVQRLREFGVTITIGHEAAAVANAQVLVVSSAINKHNPEVVEAQNRRLPIIHRSEMLAELMRLKHGIIVSGTHGKTTTTSLLAEVLTAAGLDPTAVIGGRLNAFGSNAKLGKGELFVAEADESDGSFLRLTPTVAVVTNIDRDHLDHYSGLDEIVQAFHSFCDKIPFYGAACVCLDDPGVQLLLPSLRRKVVTYGFRSDADVTVRNFRPKGFSAFFEPVVFGRALPEVELRMPGRHNVANALATYAVAHVLGLNMDLVSQTLASFQGVLHRSTLVGTRAGLTVVDDYAHNPRKIASALQALREGFPDAQVLAVFQPHRYSRLKHQGEEFAASFSHADKVIVTPIYAASEQPIPGVTQEWIAKLICNRSFQGTQGTTQAAPSLRESAQMAAHEAAHSSSDTVVVTLGAGDVASVGAWTLEAFDAEKQKS